MHAHRNTLPCEFELLTCIHNQDREKNASNQGSPIQPTSTWYVYIHISSTHKSTRISRAVHLAEFQARFRISVKQNPGRRKARLSSRTQEALRDPWGSRRCARPSPTPEAGGKSPMRKVERKLFQRRRDGEQPAPAGAKPHQLTTTSLGFHVRGHRLLPTARTNPAPRDKSLRVGS